MENSLLEEAIKRRDNFLEKHPEYKKYQKELEIRLSGITDPEIRCSMLMMLISKNMEKINTILEGVTKGNGKY